MNAGPCPSIQPLSRPSPSPSPPLSYRRGRTPFLILRHALASGRGAGLAAVAGVQLGLVVHTALAVSGVSMIIASSEVLFKGVAVAGAVYLIWLGVQGLRDADFLGLAEGGAATRNGAAWRQGMMSNILNPMVHKAVTRGSSLVLISAGLLMLYGNFLP